MVTSYDSLDRNVFFSIMEEFCIPMKLIRLTKATLMDTKCRILIQNSLSYPFDIDTGFKQGDRLSTLLFNLALEKLARAMSINWNGTRRYRIRRYRFTRQRYTQG